MAELTDFRNNALPYPVYGVPWTVVFPILDADGDPVTGATCDSEISKNGDTAVDCTNEGAEIPFTTTENKGMYYLTLTYTEMTADIVTITIHPDSGKATPIVLYPRKLTMVTTGTCAGGDTNYITLAASTVDFENQFTGCLCVATIDGAKEARVLQACNAANQQCAVTPTWNTAPDSDDTYTIYLPEGVQVPQANVTQADGNAIQQTSGYFDVNLKQILAHTLTQSNLLADGFENFFDEATPTGTVNSLPAAAPNAAGGLSTADKLLAYIQLLARSDSGIGTDRSTEMDEINNDEGSGAGDYLTQEDSLEALRDEGDTEWMTATGFSTHDAAAVVSAMQGAASDFKADVSALATTAALSTLSETVNRAVGLLGENTYHDNHSFDGNGNLTSCRIRIYSVADSVGSDNDVRATYNLTATYDADGINSYEVKKA